MKKSIILSSLLMAAALLSCQKWDAGVSEPDVAITVTPANPKVGDTVTAGNLHVTVLATDGLRVEQVLVRVDPEDVLA